jgi:hypothetical protein
MRSVIAILTLAFLAIGPAAAESAKSFALGHPYYAPAHEKKRLHMQSARRVALGHPK